MDIDRIRQIVREQGVDLKIQGLVCLPREIKKYTGCIIKHQRKGGVSYEALIRYKDFYCYKSFKTEAKAEQYISLTNVREGLPIKNSFTIFDNRVLVDLTGNKLLICNYEDLYLVETHIWHCSHGYAATRTSGGTTLQFFHNLAMQHILTDIILTEIVWITIKVILGSLTRGPRLLTRA